MARKHHSRLAKVIIASVLLAVIIAMFLGVRWWEQQTTNPEPRGDYSERRQEAVEIDGVPYRKRSNLTTILLIGVDKRETSAPASGTRNGGQADFLRLLVIDPAAKKIEQVQIDRDTMTPITILGVLGDRSGVRTAQICLSHGFGDGREQSCLLTADAVSNLLLGVPVDFYAAMSMDGIGALNDWAGGVTVTIEDDFSAFDETMVPGATVTLMGDQAELYVRSRRSVGVGTNEARMQRQQAYLSKLFDLLREKMHSSRESAGSLYDTLEPYLITNIARGRLINEAWAARDYSTELVKLAGSYSIGPDGFKEFHVDQDALQATVLRLFYEEMK